MQQVHKNDPSLVVGEKKFALVSVPLWYGAGKHGTEFAPAAFKKFCLDDKLRAQGIKIVGWYQVGVDRVKNKDSVSGKARYESEILYTLKSAFRLIKGFLEQGVIPIVLGGDHTVSIADIAAQAIFLGGARKVGVIWFDAHGDVHTPDTTLSGKFHGMPLAIVLGHGSEKFVEIGGEFGTKVCPKNVVHIGANSLEDAEIDFFNKQRISLFSKKEIETDDGFRKVCNAIIELGKRVESVVVSIDFDGFDKKDAPAVHHQNENGIPLVTAFRLFDCIKAHCNIGGVDIAEMVPRKDRDGKTVQLGYNILRGLLR